MRKKSILYSCMLIFYSFIPTCSLFPAAPPLIDKLYNAIITQDLKAVKDYIALGGDLNVIDHPSYGNFSPLHHAIRYSMKDIALELIKARANVNVFDNYGKTPLHIACIQGVTSVVEPLLNAKAHIQQPQLNDSMTPLHLASLNHHIRLIALLLARGANIKACDAQGHTPLHSALATANHLVTAPQMVKDTCSLLIANGASIHDLDHNGLTPLHLLVHENPLFADIDCLMCNLDIQLITCNSFLKGLKHGEDPKILDKLFNDAIRGYAPGFFSTSFFNIPNIHNGKTCFHFLVQAIEEATNKTRRRGLVEILDKLLLFTDNSHINAITFYGKTPLFYAKTNENLQRFLVLRGALLDDGMDSLPLIISKIGNIQSNNHPWVRFLVRFLGYYENIDKTTGFTKNINKKDNTGWTPLTYAIANKNGLVARLLIKHGAHITTQDLVQDAQFWTHQIFINVLPAIWRD